MHPENDLSRPNSGERAAPAPGGSAAPGAPPAGPVLAARTPADGRTGRPGRRGIVLGAAAVLALTRTVLGVATTGMSSSRGAATGDLRTGISGILSASRSQQGANRTVGQTGVGRRTAHQGAANQGTAHQATGHQSAGDQGHQGNQGTGHQGTAHQGTGPKAAGDAGAPAGALRTSCRNVAHIGDSTSVDLISSAILPDASQRLAARFRDVGVKNLRIDASGGRSIVEELPGQRNGYTVASGWRAHGYHGCWVFALGTNDAANVAAGSTVGLTARIDQMMAVAHGQPVMWVNTRTELNAGPWSEANEQAWDAALTNALARYPNMRIFNWAAVAKPAWFLFDGIHYNTAGCAARARAIANALARAFPLHGHSKGKVVL